MLVLQKLGIVVNQMYNKLCTFYSYSLANWCWNCKLNVLEWMGATQYRNNTVTKLRSDQWYVCWLHGGTMKFLNSLVECSWSRYSEFLMSVGECSACWNIHLSLDSSSVQSPVQSSPGNSTSQDIQTSARIGIHLTWANNSNAVMHREAPRENNSESHVRQL